MNLDLNLVGYLLFIGAFLVYAQKDKNNFKRVLEEYKIVAKQNTEQMKRIVALEGCVNTFRTVGMNYKASFTEELREVQLWCQQLENEKIRLTRNQDYLKGRIDQKLVGVDFYKTEPTKKQKLFSEIKEQMNGLEK